MSTALTQSEKFGVTKLMTPTLPYPPVPENESASKLGANQMTPRISDLY